MKKVIFSQILAGNGVTNFSGLFDENGLPVRVELEKNADGVVLAVLRRELSEDEQQKICMDYEHCQDCQQQKNALQHVFSCFFERKFVYVQKQNIEKTGRRSDGRTLRFFYAGNKFQQFVWCECGKQFH